MRVFAVISKEALPKRRISVNVVSSVFVKVFDYWTKGSKGKNAYLFQHQGHMNKMDSEYLENYVSIYDHANGLNQGVILWGTWFLCSWCN